MANEECQLLSVPHMAMHILFFLSYVCVHPSLCKKKRERKTTWKVDIKGDVTLHVFVSLNA